jgi:hypothetical protein
MAKDITISVANDGGLADPPPLIYSVTPPPLHEGDTVSDWLDSSAMLNDALKRGNPIFKEKIIGPWPVVRLGASGDGFDLKHAISGANDWTILAVIKTLNPAAVSMLMGGTDDGPFGPYFDGAVTPAASVYGRTQAQTFRSYGFETAWSVWAVSSSTALGPVCYNNGGGLDGYGVNPVSYIGDFMNIGGRQSDNLFPANLDIAEILFCGTFLGDTTIKAASQTLSDKYNFGLAVGTAIDLSMLPALQGWWKADALTAMFGGPVVLDIQSPAGEGFGAISALDASITDTGTLFTSTGGKLHHATMWVQLTGAPAGNIVCHIWSHDLTKLLAASDPIPASSFSASMKAEDFTFSGANRLVLFSGQRYGITVGRTYPDNCGCVASIGPHSTAPETAWTLNFDGSQWTNYAAYSDPFAVYVTK